MKLLDLMGNFIFNLILFFLVVLGFELRASFLLGRLSYSLSHSAF
jgi:hypothetical protein